jgi:integrase
MESGVLNHYARDTLFTAIPDRPHGQDFSSVSLSTERTYQYDWLRFCQWCLDHDRVELPAHPATVASFLQGEKETGAGMATLNRRVAAISYMHRNAGLPTPLSHGDAQIIRDFLVRPSARRPRRGAQRRSVDLWHEVLDRTAETELESLRDRALIALHVSAAFRLLELSRLTVGQIRLDRASAQINLGRFRSHTARGSSAITVIDDAPLTPVSHLRAWMETSEALTGQLFRRCTDEAATDEGLGEEEIAGIMTARITAAGHLARRVAGGLIQVREGTGEPG